jgi:hypothetical protein
MEPMAGIGPVFSPSHLQLFWASFQHASVVLKILGALVSLALVAMSGTMFWKTTRNYLSSER